MKQSEPKLEPLEGVKMCQRLCIDDLCRNNPESTLCGGSFCPSAATDYFQGTIFVRIAMKPATKTMTILTRDCYETRT